MDATTDNNREIYDTSWSAWEDMKVFGPASRWLRWLAGQALSRSCLTNVVSVLDFGCGTGVNTSFIAELFPEAEVTGCDISRSGIELAVKNYGHERMHFLVDDGTITLQKRYDLICCFEVLEHLPEWKPLLKKMTDCTRYLILSTPTGRMRPFEKTFGHVRNLKRGELENELIHYGMKKKVIYNAGFPFYSPLYRDICQLTSIDSTDFIRDRYGIVQRIVARFFYLFFRFGCSRSRGDQFCGVFSNE